LTEGIDGTEEFKTVVQGHYAKTRKTLNEVWGLTTLSDDDHYITVGDDGTIRLWSSKERKMKFARRLDVDMKGLDLALDKATGEMADTGKLRSVDISPDDKLIAVGSFDGTVRVNITWVLFDILDPHTRH
jgi:WD40 repeat protein